MKSINVAVEDAIMERAESVAASQNTSVSQLILSYLHQLTPPTISREEARRKLLELSDRATGIVGERTWTRDDLHER